MKSLPLRCAATIGWVLCLTEIDRRSDLFHLGASAYLILAASAALLLVPQLRRVSTLWVLAVAFPLFCVLELLSRPLDLTAAGGALVEFLGVAITLVLASRLARRLALAEDAIAELALGPDREPAAPFSRTQGEMFREVRRARRYERPLSLLALSASGAQPPAALERVLEEARLNGLERYVTLKVGALLDAETAASAVIASRAKHFLVMLPECERAEAESVAKRLGQAAASRYGLELRFGIASFPHQEITFDKLLETAETELRAVEQEARSARDAEAARLVPPTPARG